MLKSGLILLLALNLSSLYIHPEKNGVVDDSISSKIEALKKIFPGGEIDLRPGEYGGGNVFVVVGGKDDIDETYYRDVLDASISVTKEIDKFSLFLAPVLPGQSDEIVAIIRYRYSGIQHAECCYYAIKLVVLSGSMTDLKVAASFNITLYVEDFASIEFIDLNQDGTSEILVEYSDAPAIQTHGKQLSIFGVKDGELKLLWNGSIFIDTVFSGRVPDQSHWERFERELDLERTVRERGRFLYFTKKVSVEGGKELNPARIIHESIPLFDR